MSRKLIRRLLRVLGERKRNQQRKHEQPGREQPGHEQRRSERAGDLPQAAEDTSPEHDPQDTPPSADSSRVRSTWDSVFRANMVSSTMLAFTPEAEKFHRFVLEPLGISIVRDGRLPTGLASLFSSGARHAAQHAHHPDSLCIDTEAVRLFLADYNHLLGIKATGHMLAASLQHFLLPRHSLPDGISSSAHHCYIQRWLRRSMPSDECCHYPPVLAPGYDVSVAATLYPPAPSLSYWLSLKNTSDFLTVHLGARLSTDRTFAAYLTVEYHHDENQRWNEVDRMAFARSVALYNRFRLREKALEQQGISIRDVHSMKDVQHFGITFSAQDTFTAWSFEPCSPLEPSATASASVVTQNVLASRLPISTKPGTKASESKAAAAELAGRAIRKIPTLAGAPSAPPPPPPEMPDLTVACHDSAWRGCRVNQVLFGSLLQEGSVGALAGWISQTHQWALESHAGAIFEDLGASEGLHRSMEGGGAGGGEKGVGVQGGPAVNPWASD